MKRIILFSAIFLMQAFTVFAQAPTSRVNDSKVKMFRQPGINTEVMRLLNPEDEIVVMRKVSSEWSLVQIDGEGGYVLNSYLKARKNKKGATAKAASTPAPTSSIQ